MFDSLTETKQILITGDGDDQAPKMELLERNGSSTICQASSFKYPIDVNYASGALVGTTMVLCGGYGDDTYYDSCYRFDKQDNQWTFLSKMSTPRKASAAISIHNGVWITGGDDEQRNDLSSTEFIFLNGTKKDGPSLPQPRSFHCLVQYKSTIFLTGGFGGERSIVIYRQVKENIEEIGNGPDMTNDTEEGMAVESSTAHNTVAGQSSSLLEVLGLLQQPANIGTLLSLTPNGNKVVSPMLFNFSFSRLKLLFNEWKNENAFSNLFEEEEYAHPEAGKVE